MSGSPRPLRLFSMAALAAVLKVKSEPFVASELHFIFLFNFTLMVLPSQLAVAEDKCGFKGSVMLALPPEKERS